MSLESSLQSTLLTVCPRAFPDYAPPGTATPFVTWQQIGGKELSYADDTVPDKRNARIQITVWAETRIAANALSLQIEAAMIAQSNRAIGALLATHDEDANLRGAMQDFTVWASR